MCRGWIPAFAGMTEVGDLGAFPLTNPQTIPIIEHMSHKARRGAHRNGAAGKGSYPSLADIVRKETDGGRLVVRFLLSAMQGNLQDAEPYHRLDAARQLLKLGADVAQHGLADSASNRGNGSNANHASNGRNGPRMPLNQQLADFIRLQTKGGKAAVRFLVDVMRGNLEGFKPHHRLSAAKELLRLCQDDKAAGDDDEYGDDVWRGPTYMPIKQQPKARRRRNGTMRKDDNRGDTTATPKDDSAEKTAALERDRTQMEGAEHDPAQSDGETAEPTADRSHGPDAPQQDDGAEVPWYDRPTLPVITIEEHEASKDPQQDGDPSIESSHHEREAIHNGVDIWRDPADSWISADLNPLSHQPSTRIDSTSLPRGP